MVMITAAFAASPIGLISSSNETFLKIGKIVRQGLMGSESFDGYEYIMDEGGGGGEESEVEWRVVSR